MVVGWLVGFGMVGVGLQGMMRGWHEARRERGTERRGQERRGEVNTGAEGGKGEMRKRFRKERIRQGGQTLVDGRM